jgi:hypothetical protein
VFLQKLPSANHIVSIPHWFDSSSRARRHCTRRRPEFQFHIGSIQARLLIQIIGTYLLFQFHIGSIQATGGQEWSEEADEVSIPHWFDSSATEPDWPDGEMSVSIPHWFDSSWSLPPASLRALPSFNSTLVRFKHSVEDPLPAITGQFQFHIGSIQAALFICFHSIEVNNLGLDFWDY